MSRPQESYLEQTLTELFSKASVSEMEDVAVIVFLADLDERKAKEQVLKPEVYFFGVFFVIQQFSRNS